MTGPVRIRASRVVLGVLVPALLIAGLLWLDRGSLQRGNRLYRAGESAQAADVYRRAAERTDEPPPVAPYNLGTALLGLDAEEAEAQLRTAVDGADATVVQHGLYNLGYRYLSAVSGAMEPDSMLAVLGEAVASFRGALRLDPSDERARWNLALAQRRLDALAPVNGTPDVDDNAGTSDDEIEIDDQSLSRSETAEAVSGLEPEDPRPADNIGERSGSQQGAREAWAAQDPGPMTRDVAFGLLGGVKDNPETLVRGFLWSHRPDVPWWESHAYPGGGW